MPLSVQQVEKLKNPTTAIAFQCENPKAPGTKANQRYDKYKNATNVKEALANGATTADLNGDFEKSFLKFVDDEGDNDVNMKPKSGKHSAPLGSPDREAESRAKRQSTLVVQEAVTERVEMSGATISALRGMMREEIKECLIEAQVIMDQKVEELRAELQSEKEARQDLEQRIAKLESKVEATPADEVTEVDKSVAVVGGFTKGLSGDEAEDLVSNVMKGLDGFEEVYATTDTPTVVFARFKSVDQCMKFVRKQKRIAKLRDASLWASENRTLTERRRGQVMGKIKKNMIELDGFDPKDVITNYKTFRVHARVNKRLEHIANIPEDFVPEWLNDDIVGEDVKSAVQDFIDELEM